MIDQEDTLDNIGASNRVKKKTNTRTLKVLTQNDSKVLGRTIDRKREKTIPPTKFKTRQFKTHNSNWTPLANKASNEQVRYPYKV